MATGVCYLKQSDFGANCVGGFQELKNAGELLDVTLACGDEGIQAHKLVLAACSPFFRKVLNQTKHEYPYIYIKGINFKDLLSIMHFIYNGETQIPAEDIPRFIEAAQELKIKGLGPEDIKRVLPESLNEKNQYNERVKTAKRKKNQEKLTSVQKEESVPGADNSNLYEIVENDSAINNSFDKELIKINNKLSKMKRRKIEKINEIKETLEEQYNPNDTLDSVLPVHLGEKYEITFGEVKDEASDDSAMVIDGSSVMSEQNPQLDLEISMRIGKMRDSSNHRMWKCKVCGKITRNKKKLSRHVETHLTGFSHSCDYCDKTFKTRNSLHTHINSLHGK